MSTATQYKSFYVIFDHLVMLAFPLSVCNVSQFWVKFKNKLGCSSLAVAFYKGEGNGSKGREDTDIHMN